jgi:putative lipoprotein
MTRVRYWVLFVCGNVLVACGKQPVPTVSQPILDSAPSASTESATEPPAESSLAIKRGVITVASDRITFRLCEDKVDLWLVDQTDGGLDEATGPRSSSTAAMYYIEANGERGPALQDPAAARAYAGAFSLEQVLYAAPQAQLQGCDAPAPDYVVVARGHDPDWSVQIDEAKATWQGQDHKDIALGALETQDAEGTAQYDTNSNGHKMQLLVAAQPCKDLSTNEYYAYAAKAVLDGKSFSGCARVGK